MDFLDLLSVFGIEDVEYLCLINKTKATLSEFGILSQPTRTSNFTFLTIIIKLTTLRAFDVKMSIQWKVMVFYGF